MKVILAETKRTSLCQHSEAFRDCFVKLNCDPVARSEMNGPHNQESANRLFNTILNLSSHSPWQCLAVTDKQTKGFIGHVFLIEDEDNHDAGLNFELGFIFDPAYWGKGIASEVLAEFLPLALKNIEPTNVIATVNVGHYASQKILEKLGFVFARTAEDDYGPYRYYRLNL